MKRSVLALAAFALSLTGCMVGPNYKRPAVATPQQFRGAPAGDATPGAATPDSIAETKWFDLFQDDTVKQLVTSALEKNFDLRIAAERVLEARAQYGIVRGNLFPTLDGQAQFAATRSSSIGASRFIPAGANLTSSYTQATFDLNWELDLWGRLRRLNEAARAQYLATEEARNGVKLSLIGDVMNTYFALREQDLELEISRQTGDIANDNLRLINLRHDRGAANALDVHQAEQFLYTATAQIRQFAARDRGKRKCAQPAAGERALTTSLAARLSIRSQVRRNFRRDCLLRSSNVVPTFARPNKT